MDLPEIKVRRFSRSKIPQEENEAPPEALPEAPVATIKEEAVNIVDNEDMMDESFLSELKGEQQTPPPPPPPPSPVAEKTKKKGKAAKSDFADLFSAKESTPILGREKRELLTKIQEYRALFPLELKYFKLKPNASVEQLQESLSECEVIVACSSGMNKMLDESLLSVISVLESISSRTENWDVSGTAEALRQNSDFQMLCKRLYLKHRLFSDVPVEGQLALLVCGTMMTMRGINIKKKEIGSLLGQPF